MCFGKRQNEHRRRIVEVAATNHESGNTLRWIDCILVALLMLAVIAGAWLSIQKTNEIAERCARESGDASISACTQAIYMPGGNSAGREGESARHAPFLAKRGYEYYMKGEFDKTISDFTKVIRVRPDYENAQSYLKLAIEARAKLGIEAKEKIPISPFAIVMLCIATAGIFIMFGMMLIDTFGGIGLWGELKMDRAIRNRMNRIKKGFF